jgi:hypothetical protein
MTRVSKLRTASAALMMALGGLLATPTARAADLDELTKYLAFIEGFQYFFEFCQAETRLPDAQVTFARAHVGERRALIFAGLSATQRDRIAADMPPKRAQMIKNVLDHFAKDQPGVPLKHLCLAGFFEGVMDSEQKSIAKEVAAIRKAKD